MKSYMYVGCNDSYRSWYPSPKKNQIYTIDQIIDMVGRYRVKLSNEQIANNLSKSSNWIEVKDENHPTLNPFEKVNLTELITKK